MYTPPQPTHPGHHWPTFQPATGPSVHPQPKCFPGFQLRRLIVEKWRIPSVADGDWRVQEAPIAPWREPPRSLSFKPLEKCQDAYSSRIYGIKLKRWWRPGSPKNEKDKGDNVKSKWSKWSWFPLTFAGVSISIMSVSKCASKSKSTLKQCPKIWLRYLQFLHFLFWTSSMFYGFNAWFFYNSASCLGTVLKQGCWQEHDLIISCIMAQCPQEKQSSKAAIHYCRSCFILTRQFTEKNIFLNI